MARDLLPSEHEIQAAFVDYVLFKYDGKDDTFIRKLFFAPPNGMWAGGSSKRGKFGLINKFLKEGYTKGVADLFYLQPRGAYPWLSMEFKTEKGRQTIEQFEFGLATALVGGYHVLVRSTDDAIEKFDEYMSLLPIIRK